MGLPFKEIYTQVGQFVQDTSAGRLTRIKDAINRSYRELTEGEDWPDLWRIELAEVNLFAGVPYFYLPAHIDVVKKIVLDSNKDILTTQDPSMFLERFFDTLSTSANPYTTTPLGSSPIKRRIASAETLNFVSSDATDTSQAVEVWGLVAGEEINETVTLNGTTVVPTTNTFSRITRIGTSTSRADSSRLGHITVTGVTSSLEYAVIKNHEFESRYQQFRAQDGPNANDTLTVFYKKKATPLIADGDTLELDCDLTLIQMAIRDVMQQQGEYTQANVHAQQAEVLRIKLKSRYIVQTDAIIQSMPVGPGTRGNHRFRLFDRRISVVGGS